MNGEPAAGVPHLFEHVGLGLALAEEISSHNMKKARAYGGKTNSFFQEELEFIIAV